MVRLSEIKSSDKVLDIGCRNQILKFYLPFNIDYTGIDKSYNPDIKWDIEKGLPRQIMMSKFDVIFLGEVIEHIENHRTLLKDCRKILKPKGRIILSTPLAWRLQWKTDTDHIHSFTPLNLRVLTKQYGLKITKMIGSFIEIPFFRWRIPVDWSFYTTHIIVKIEKC